MGFRGLAMEARPTFKQACEAVVQNSAIKMWLDGDRQQPWHAALEYDLAAAKDIFSKLAADLSAITRRKVVVEFDFQPLIDRMMLKSFSSIEDRMLEAYRIFENELSSEIATLKERIAGLSAWRKHSEHIQYDYNRYRTKTTYYTFPLAAINLPRNTDTMTFGFTDEFKCRAVHYVLVDPKLVEPASFARKLPERIHHKLAVLEKTNFDFSAMILDGYLVQAKEAEEEKASGPVGPDPGLVIKIWDQLMLVDYWYEPTRNRPATRFWYGLKRKVVRSSVFWAGSLSLLAASVVSTVCRPETFPLLVVTLVTNLGLILTCLFTATGNPFRTKADIFQPNKKLVM